MKVIKVINVKGEDYNTLMNKANSFEFQECSPEFQKLVMEILKLLMGNSVIASKEVLEVCLKEIEYFSIL